MIRKLYWLGLPAAFLLLIATLASVPAWAQKLPQTAKKNDRDSKETQPAKTSETDPSKPGTAGVGLPVDPNAYLIGGEDVLAIQTWRHPEFSFNIAVRPDGKLSLPLVGEMQVAGLTPEQFRKKYSEAIADYVKNPEVFIHILEVRSKKYFVDGEVARAGEYPLIGPIRVLEALSRTGGFREFANRKKIRILRGSQTFRFNWEEVMKGKKMEQNILLENGDHIFVPE
jgi:polysaccharide biosynthesis/export protein